MAKYNVSFDIEISDNDVDIEFVYKSILTQALVSHINEYMRYFVKSLDDKNSELKSLNKDIANHHNTWAKILESTSNFQVLNVDNKF